MPISQDEFIAAWNKNRCSPQNTASYLGVNIRAVYRRRARLAEQGIILETVPALGGNNEGSAWREIGRAYKRVNETRIENGSVVVFSDAHFWPDQPKSIAHQALLEVIKQLKPKAVIANGDIFDGARVSRHAPLGWAKLPTVKEELEICEEYMHEILLAADPKRCDLFWNVGNHDQRFDRMLVSNASEYEGILQRLDDRFSQWDFAWSLDINSDVMVKHRYHNGVHAGYNNTLKSGRSIVTGHLHRLLVTPFADYNGRRYGVDTGTLSDTLSPQFDYAENNPSPHTSGFAVLTFKDGKLLPPELCECLDNHAYFRGAEVI